MDIIEFLMVIPNNVTNPTIAPTDNQPPDIKTAAIPPTKQKGRFKRTIIRFLFVFKANFNNTITPIKAIKLFVKRLFTVVFAAVLLPAYAR